MPIQIQLAHLHHHQATSQPKFAPLKPASAALSNSEGLLGEDDQTHNSQAYHMYINRPKLGEEQMWVSVRSCVQ